MTGSHLEYKYMTQSHLPTSTKRARRDEQKQERRETILDTAWGMFQCSSYDAVTMDAVARETHLAKGTLFLYFRTKEELFLALTKRQLAEWFARVNAQLASLAAPASTETVAEIIAGSVQGHNGFVRLMSILSTGLEQNVSFEASLAFKQPLLTQMIHTGTVLERCLIFLQPGQGAHLLMQCQALLVGFWHLAAPAPVIREVLKLPEMQLFAVNFDHEFRLALLSLLNGLERIDRRP